MQVCQGSSVTVTIAGLALCINIKLQITLDALVQGFTTSVLARKKIVLIPTLMNSV